MTKPLPSPMGRPRTFVPEQLLQVALKLFWEQGYRATSLDDLTAAMHLSRSSFYAAFGSKKDVLLAAVQAYVDRIYDALLACEKQHDVPDASVRAMLRTMADPGGDRRGCLLVNAITELAPDLPELAVLARAHIERVVKLIASHLIRLGNSKHEASSKAATLMACAFGIAVMRKADVESKTLKAMMRHIDALILPDEDIK